jgi:hypothetical protein
MLDFLCIGAQKAGTTRLAAQLRENPEVWLHPFKELHDFDRLYYPPSRHFPLAHLQRPALERIEEEFITERAASRFDHIAWLARCADCDWAFTDDWYRYCFSRVPPGLKTGECTPAYACIGQDGVAHVRRLMPDVRIIYIIRNPVMRACSQIRMNVSQKGGPADVRSAEAAAASDEVLERSDYARSIAAWEAAFDRPEQILYVPYGRIAADPDGVLNRIEGHIGVGRGGRGRIGKRVSLGAPVVLPETAGTALQRRLAPQYAFLERRFGAAFVAEM